eukprot:scaffold97228_cov18-Tisochrysis_lutea.AAC.2
MPSLQKGHADLLCITPILAYVPKDKQGRCSRVVMLCSNTLHVRLATVTESSRVIQGAVRRHEVASRGGKSEDRGQQFLGLVWTSALEFLLVPTCPSTLTHTPARASAAAPAAAAAGLAPAPAE